MRNERCNHRDVNKNVEKAMMMIKRDGYGD